MRWNAAVWRGAGGVVVVGCASWEDVAEHFGGVAWRSFRRGGSWWGCGRVPVSRISFGVRCRCWDGSVAMKAIAILFSCSS